MRLETNSRMKISNRKQNTWLNLVREVNIFANKIHVSDQSMIFTRKQQLEAENKT